MRCATSDRPSRTAADIATRCHSAADHGDASAQTNLGQMYRNGRGVLQDDVEAVKWHRLAADQGDPTGQANLGIMYELGRGVPQDDVEAHRWYDLAFTRAADETRTLFMNFGDGVAERMNAERTRELFMTLRDDVAERMTTEQIAEATRRARQWAPTVGP